MVPFLDHCSIITGVCNAISVSLVWQAWQLGHSGSMAAWSFRHHTTSVVPAWVLRCEGGAQVNLPYHIRVLVPCYKESFDIVTRTIMVSTPPPAQNASRSVLSLCLACLARLQCPCFCALPLST